MPRRHAVPARLRVVSEPTRQRETYKYGLPLLNNIKFNDTGVAVPSEELVTCDDPVLTALAQLGACRLNTARALVSIFDRDYQYIIAEATPTIPLKPNLQHGERDEDLWLCGTAIPRQHGVCEYALRAIDPTQFEDGDDPRTLPIAVVPDLTADERFSSKPYCKPGSPARFYAAVPIRTPQGINIGVYCVIDTEPRDAALWDSHQTELLRSLSGAIVAHLDLRRSTTINRRGNLMNRGIASFINGKSSIDAWSGDPVSVGVDGAVQGAGRPGTTQADGIDQLDPKDGGQETGLSPVRGAGDGSASIGATGEGQATPQFAEPEAVAPSQGESVGRHEDRIPRQETLRGIFSRAAQIITESVEVDGFLFLDASVGLYGSATGDPESTNSPSSSAASGEDPEQSELHTAGQGPTCRVLGVSATKPSPDTNPESPPFALPHKVLSKLLHRYPKGRVFNFDDKGDLQHSDSSEGQSTLAARKGSRGPSGAGGVDGEPKEKQRTSRLQEGSAILGALPGVRSVAFVPVWHATKERWFAGGFAFTYDDHRILTTEDELSYLRAFGMLTMEECFRLETQMADKAKSDVLNSLSHELRSPLHGIVLGIELLNDTELSVFQGNIVHTIETCSRTLLDTVDHLLDFSKINNYMAKKKRTAGGERGLRQGRFRTIEAGMQTLYSVVRLDVLVADVMESVCAGFNFQHASLSQVGREHSVAYADVRANRRLDMMRAMEELGPNQTATGGFRYDFASVSIFIDVEPDVSWVFNTQPGAVRRIVMNLFGNSLKYTRRGTIVVALRLGSAAKRKGGKTRVVNITVADTGKGIGEDYLRHELFRPFSQEDHLAPGTGLGLSLVKQITSQLKGTISVSSTVGVGTTVAVSLPMLPSEDGSIAPSEENTEFVQGISDVKGQRARLVGFSKGKFDGPLDAEAAKDERFNNYKLVEGICHDWLRLSVSPDSDDQAPDLVICEEGAVDHFATDSEYPASIPCVVICSNTLIAHQLSMTSEFITNPRVFDFVSQPIGPRKLAKVLSRALKRAGTIGTNEATQAPTSDETSPQAVSVAAPLSVKWTPTIVKKQASQEASVPTLTPAPTDLDANVAAPESHLPTIPDAAAADKPPEGAAEFLLVDDNHINLKILSSYTNKIGRPYSTASNGLEAVEAFARGAGRYKCVFMDISMPVMDGFEATRRIRAHERDRGLKPASIFALSGLASASAQQEAFECGIDLFLTKPVRLKELGTILEASGLL